MTEVINQRTELNFEGDIRNLKGFLLNNAHLLPTTPIKEEHREILLRTRRKVFQRNKGLCEICGEKGTETDHILPFCVGGTHKLSNLRLVCRRCNMQEFLKIKTLCISVANKPGRTVRIEWKK